MAVVIIKDEAFKKLKELAQKTNRSGNMDAEISGLSGIIAVKQYLKLPINLDRVIEFKGQKIQIKSTKGSSEKFKFKDQWGEVKGFIFCSIALSTEKVAVNIRGFSTEEAVKSIYRIKEGDWCGFIRLQTLQQKGLLEPIELFA